MAVTVYTTRRYATFLRLGGTPNLPTIEKPNFRGKKQWRSQKYAQSSVNRWSKCQTNVNGLLLQRKQVPADIIFAYS